MFTVSTWTCQARFGSFSIVIMQLTETMVTPSMTACPVAGSSGYVARPSMSARASPESSTAPFTASSACAASGISAERVTREKPTPLTATLHRCSHISWRLLAWGPRHGPLIVQAKGATPPSDSPGQCSARRGAAVARLCNALRVRQAELRQRDVVVQRLEDYFHATAHLRLRVRRVEQVSRQQRAGSVIELDDDA